jgi:hypothetical protein
MYPEGQYLSFIYALGSYRIQHRSIILSPGWKIKNENKKKTKREISKKSFHIANLF